MRRRRGGRVQPSLSSTPRRRHPQTQTATASAFCVLRFAFCVLRRQRVPSVLASAASNQHPSPSPSLLFLTLYRAPAALACSTLAAVRAALPSKSSAHWLSAAVATTARRMATRVCVCVQRAACSLSPCALRPSKLGGWGRRESARPSRWGWARNCKEWFRRCSPHSPPFLLFLPPLPLSPPPSCLNTNTPPAPPSTWARSRRPTASATRRSRCPSGC